MNKTDQDRERNEAREAALVLQTGLSVHCIDEWKNGFDEGYAARSAQQADELAAVRRVLLLTSYCGDESDCSERVPCHDCLLMCNVAVVEVNSEKVYGGLGNSSGLEVYKSKLEQEAKCQKIS